MRETEPQKIPCGSTRNKNITTTTPQPRTRLFQEDQNSPIIRTPNPEGDKSPLFQTLMRTIPPSLSTTTQYLLGTSQISDVENSTTSLPFIMPTSSNHNERTTGLIPTTEMTTVATCENAVIDDFTYTVSVRDAKFIMNRLNIVHVRTMNGNYGKEKPKKRTNSFPSCTSPPPTFPLCNFPFEREKS